MGEDGPRPRTQDVTLLIHADEGETDRPRNFHGRRKGKALRPGQARLLADLLPRLAVPGHGPVDPAALFGSPTGRLVLEIGFGGGEHLAGEASAFPDDRFIGCEPFVNGLVKLLARAEREHLANLRLWPDDVWRLLDRLPAASLDRVYLLYPDPWPKRRQRKRRLFSDALLAALASAMRPGAELCMVTDIDDYAGWALARVFGSADFSWDARGSADWRRPWSGWIETRYETKAYGASRVPSYLVFRRV